MVSRAEGASSAMLLTLLQQFNSGFSSSCKASSPTCSAGTNLPIAPQTNLQRGNKILLVSTGLLFRNKYLGIQPEQFIRIGLRGIIISITGCGNGSEESDMEENSECYLPLHQLRGDMVNKWCQLSMTTAHWPLTQKS